ncbi:hypothetical protein K440DRAFT_661715 [Wilcoxina mikolae CBS 423.85]|nr:hypothetical protein K440DRAFT_661715 [Wilcoxina mikolae CBS 423.85]
MPSTTVFRARGLPRDATTSDFLVLKQFLKPGEQLNLVDELIVPSCAPDNTKTGLFGLSAPLPGFLKRLRDSPSETFDFEIRGNDVEVDLNFAGFTQLYPTPLGEHILADIVALTGLNGHAYGSWKSKSNLDRMWLRHFLSEDFPYCRTLTYGYNADLRSKSRHLLVDYCRRFLTDIQDLRRIEEEQRRPLIFIGHSYGGLLVAHSLVKAKFDQCGSDHPLDTLLKATFGILFFGTPHRGMVVGNLRTALEQSGNDQRADLLEEINENCRELKKDLDRFIDLCDGFKICSFYETSQTPGVVVMPNGTWIREAEYAIAVADESAILQLPTSIERKISVDRDHSMMIKFKTKIDAVYCDIRRELGEMISLAPDVIAARFCPFIKPEYQLPPKIPFDRNRNFTGRVNELCQLSTLLHGSHVSKKVAVLYGMGGIGKTEIAAEYAIKNSKNYSSIWWINCATAAGWMDTVAIAQELLDHYMSAKAHVEAIVQFDNLVRNGRITDDRKESDHLISALSRWFKRLDNPRWLIILDNVDDIKHFDKRLLLQGCPHGAFIIVTRRQDLARPFPAVLVSEMPDDDSLMLFRKATNLNISAIQKDPLSRVIISKLGFLPLAISQAGAYISSRGISLKRYLEIYEREFRLIWEEKHNVFGLPEKATKEGKTVYTTWKISLNAIQIEAPEAARIFMLCAFFSNEGITDRMIELGLNYNNSGFLVEDQLKVLFSYSLAKRQAASYDFRIHPLVHRWAREHVTPSHKAQLLADCVLLMDRTVRAINSEICTETRVEMCSNMKILAHIEVLSTSLNDTSCSTAGSQPLARLALFCYEHGRWKEAEELYAPVVDKRKRALGQEHPSTLVSMSNLASTIGSQGRWKEAEKLYLQVMEIREKVLGQEHPSTLISASNLALTYVSQSRWEEAENLGRQVIERRKKVLGEEHNSTLSSMANLAWTFWNQERWNEAEDLGTRVMEIRKRLLGEDHRLTLTSISNVASTYREQGRWQEAEVLEVKLVETGKKVFGQEHPLTLVGIENLALTYMSQGRWKEAEELEAKVVRARQCVLGRDHPDTLSSMANLASIYRKLGRWKEIEELELQTINRKRAKL